MGKFIRAEDAPEDTPNTNVESIMASGKKRKLDLYSDVFCHFYTTEI